MVAYLIVNPLSTELTNVNAGGTDVLAYSVVDSITLTDTELAALIVAGGFVLKTAPTDALRRMSAKVLKLSCNPGAIVY